MDAFFIALEDWAILFYYPLCTHNGVNVDKHG